MNMYNNIKYRLNGSELIATITAWSKFVKRSVRLVACGGTAMTLLGIKASTKDIDFMVPDKNEYKYLVKVLSDIGYKPSTPFKWQRDGESFEIDLFSGNKIHTTELLESPLNEGNHIFFQRVGRIYIGILNFYDLISSKLFRGTTVDFDDCLSLVKASGDEIDKERLVRHYKEMASYEIAEERIKGHIDSFLKRWEKEVKGHGE